MTTFVSIGNGTQSFARLLDEVKRVADQLPQPVIVQYGRTPFQHDTIEAFDFVDEASFRRLLTQCTVFITHGGGGSVFSAIKVGKKPVVVPRLARFGEVVDDHQIAFAQELVRQEKIIAAFDVSGLLDAVRNAQANPALPEATTDKGQAVEIIADSVRAVAPNQHDKICLVTPSGGHLTEMRELAPVYRNRAHFFVINVPIVESDDMAGRTFIITLSQRDLKFFVNLWEAFVILRRERPKVILTTGGGFSVAFALVGKLLSIPTIYIETVAKVNIPTATGRIMYFLAGRFFYQWPYLEKFFPKGQYVGLIM
jgi:UDP-N-acetylglucosamine transferase subunit ALG13